MSTRIVAPTRLHFGLLHVPTDEATTLRRFGGLGLMLAEPRIVVRVEASDSWQCDGPSGERALAFARRVADRPMRVTVEECPPEHVGLGVGTQLGLAVAEATCRELGLPATDLAARAGRGERSGIGVHGYEHGGLILDGGRGRQGVSVILHHGVLPADWRVVLARPRVDATWHGSRERQAFARHRDAISNLRVTDQLCRLALLGVVPASVEGDFGTFASSLGEYNLLAGQAFAEDQGGPYAGPEVTRLIDTLRGWGHAGVGQSSWGPTVFAFASTAVAAATLVAQLKAKFPDLDALHITTPAARGAHMESSMFDAHQPP